MYNVFNHDKKEKEKKLKKKLENQEKKNIAKKKGEILLIFR